MTTTPTTFLDVNEKFGGHMGAVLNTLHRHLRSCGYWSSSVGTHVESNLKAYRYMRVAREPLGVTITNEATIVLMLQAAEASALIEMTVGGPMIAGVESVVWEMVILKQEAVFSVLHDLLPHKFLPKLMDALRKASAPASKKHWVPPSRRTWTDYI